MMLARRTRSRHTREQGQAAVEFMGVLWLLLLSAFAVWQLLLVTTTVTATENAARTASRAVVLNGGGSAGAYAREALPGWLAGNASVSGGIGGVTVRVRVPIIVPGFTSGQFVVTRSANLP